MNKKRNFFVSVAPPLGTKEHDEWSHKMMRIQMAMYVDDGATCEHCGYTYKSTDDFIRCNPRQGLQVKKGMSFVCSTCWPEYVKSQK